MKVKLKVILLAKVPRLGNPGDVVEVARGYAMNNLFPLGIAKPASEHQLQVAEEMKKKIVIAAEEMKERAAEIKEKLEGVKTITVKVKASDTGKLYGALADKDILNAVKEAAKVELDSSALAIKNPIKELGEHEVAVHLAEGIDTTMKVNVEAE